MMYHRHSRNPEQGSATLALAIGGAFQATVKHPEILGVDGHVYIDAHAEVENLFPSASELSISVSLAGGDTLKTLLEKEGACGKLLQFMAEHPAADLNTGLCQVRVVGALAARQFLRSRHFQVLSRHLFDDLLEAHQGLLKRLDLFTFSSNAGAVGGPNALEIAKHLSESWRQRSRATVHLHVFRVGSMAYSKYGERVHQNAAAALEEDLQELLSPGCPAREIRSLYLTELPMVGLQKGLLDSLAMQLAQVFRAKGTQEHLQRAAPNEALGSPFGAVRILRPVFFQAISDQRIAAEIASVYLAILSEIEKAMLIPGVGEEIRLPMTEEPVTHLPSPDEMIRLLEAQHVDPHEFRAWCLETPVRHQARDALISMPGQLPKTLSDLLAESVRTPAEEQRKLAELRTLHQRLGQTLDQCQNVIATVEERLTALKSNLDRDLEALYPTSFLSRLLGLVADPAQTMEKIRNDVVELRAQVKDLDGLKQQKSGFEQAYARVGAEREGKESRLKKACAILQTIEGCLTVPGSIRAAPIDKVFGELMEEVQQIEEDAIPASLLRLLAPCAAQVSLAGLAEIVGAPDSRLSSIATRLLRCENVVESPPWGGMEPISAPKRILVLPPMRPQDIDDLRHVLTELDRDLVVTAADTAQAGVNVVLLNIYVPASREEIMTPLYAQSLQEAQAAPHLFFARDIFRQTSVESNGVHRDTPNHVNGKQGPVN